MEKGQEPFVDKTQSICDNDWRRTVPDRLAAGRFSPA